MAAALVNSMRFSLAVVQLACLLASGQAVGDQVLQESSDVCYFVPRTSTAASVAQLQEALADSCVESVELDDRFSWDAAPTLGKELALEHTVELAASSADGQHVSVDVPRLFKGVTVQQDGQLLVRDLVCNTCLIPTAPFVSVAPLGPGGSILLDSLELCDPSCRDLGSSVAIQGLRLAVHRHATGRTTFKTVGLRILRLLGSVDIPGGSPNSSYHLRNISLSCGQSIVSAQRPSGKVLSSQFLMVAMWSVVAAAIYLYVSHLSISHINRTGDVKAVIKPMPVAQPPPEPEQLDPALKLMVEHGIMGGSLIGQGSFGRVYRGWFKGHDVAVKIVEFAVEDEENTKHILLECNLATAFCHPAVVYTLTCMVDVFPVSEYLARQQCRTARRVLLGSKGPDSKAGYERARGTELDGGAGTPLQAAEAQAHPHLLKAFRVILVMENCDGGTLWTALQQGWFHTPGGWPNMDVILRTALEVATALSYLHGLRVIHTDVTSRNILLKRCSQGPDRRGFTAKVADFGLSMLLDANQTHSSTAMRGTLAYMPPEMLMGTNLTFATDIYSFGIILWELFTRECPYALLSEPQIVARKVRDSVDLRPPASCPPGYAALIQACLSRDPLRRPSIELVEAWLLRLLEDLQSEDSTPAGSMS